MCGVSELFEDSCLVCEVSQEIESPSRFWVLRGLGSFVSGFEVSEHLGGMYLIYEVSKFLQICYRGWDLCCCGVCVSGCEIPVLLGVACVPRCEVSDLFGDSCPVCDVPEFWEFCPWWEVSEIFTDLCQDLKSEWIGVMFPWQVVSHIPRCLFAGCDVSRVFHCFLGCGDYYSWGTRENELKQR